MTSDSTLADVLIVGAGPAGLTAALVLARAGRSVAVLDAGAGRNAPAAHAYGVFTRDGTSPADLRAIGRAQAEHYGARFVLANATHAEADADGVRVSLGDGTDVSARRLLLATGVVDGLPAIPGLAEVWGETAVYCPYCHGFELRGRPTVILGRGVPALHYAAMLPGWTDQLTLLTDGPAGFSDDERATLARLGVPVREERVARLDVDGRALRAVVFETGERLDATALYVNPPQHLRGPLPAALGLALTDIGRVEVDMGGRTSVPNVWACGDMAAMMQSVMSATASGSLTAAMLNHDLIAAGHGYVPLGAP